MAKKADRVIIDTNLWISYLITKGLKSLDNKITTGKIKVIFSLELIEEFLSVAHRPKFKKYFTRLRKGTTAETQTLYTMPRDRHSASNIGTFACHTFPRDTKASKRAKSRHIFKLIL